MEKGKQIRSGFLLALAALIWGVAFVAQSEGMNYVGPFTFNAVRLIVGGLVLLPVIALTDASKKKSGAAELNAKSGGKHSVLVGGLLCGLVLFIASSLQQIGVMGTSVGKSGFITALYIVIVPLMGLLFRRRPAYTVWIAVALAVAGMYLLCITESFTVAAGDMLLLACAFCFAIHILVIDAYSPYVDGVRLSCIQFFTAGILSIAPMLLLETPLCPDLVAKWAPLLQGYALEPHAWLMGLTAVSDSWLQELGARILTAWLPILYAGVMSCGVAYTLQIIGQKNMQPAVASLILSLESVFAVLAGWVILGQKLSVRELIGCAVVFAAILLAQMPPFKRKKALEKAGEE